MKKAKRKTHRQKHKSAAMAVSKRQLETERVLQIVPKGHKLKSAGPRSR